MLSNGVRTTILTVVGFLALIAMRRRLMFTESGSAQQFVRPERGGRVS
jgi:hypothetical protein